MWQCPSLGGTWLLEGSVVTAKPNQQSLLLAFPAVCSAPSSLPQELVAQLHLLPMALQAFTLTFLAPTLVLCLV